MALLIAALAPTPVIAKPAPELGRLEQRIERLERVRVSDRMVELIRRIGDLETQIRRLRGQVQVQAHRIDELRGRQRRLYADFDRRLRKRELAGPHRGQHLATDSAPSSMETAGARGSGAGAARAARRAAEREAGAGSVSGDQPADAARSADEREAYDWAFKLLAAERYSEAVAALRTFVERFPDSAYADEAHYWIGEAYYVRDEFRQAVEAYRKVPRRFPDSPKLPAALLKIGYSLAHLGRTEDAESALRRVIEQYPDSSSARLAETELLKILG